MDLTRKGMGMTPVLIIVVVVVFTAVPGKGIVAKHKVNAAIPDASDFKITNVRTYVGVGLGSKTRS